MVDVPRNIGDYANLLDNGTPFSMANIGGDGEFLTIVGWGGVNSDSRESTPEKAAALARVILEPRLTYHGYNPGRLESEKRTDAEAWLRGHGVNVPVYECDLQDPDFGSSVVNVRWVHKEIISSANVAGRLAPFIAALRRRSLLVVGANWLTDEFVRGVLGADRLYAIPPEVGWEALDDIEGHVEQDLGAMPDDAVVTWGLGYLTKVLMWRLAPKYPALTQIDVGAVWDPYCGVLNRHGYKRPEWPEAMERNLVP